MALIIFTELLVSFFTTVETSWLHFFIFGEIMVHMSSNMERIMGLNFVSE